MRTAEPNDNLLSVWMAAEILCVRCRSCGHRATLRLPKLDIHRGNMTTLASLKLRCLACNKPDVEMLIPRDQDEEKLFLSGS